MSGKPLSPPGGSLPGGEARTTTGTTARSTPTLGAMRFEAEAAQLWRTYVPRSGQAATVQGELIRAVEKLRDEAQRNGNCNWDGGFEILAGFLRSRLVDSGIFSAQVVAEIEHDANRLLSFEYPEIDDGPYDRLTDRVVEWARAHPGPVPHQRNPDLHR